MMAIEVIQELANLEEADFFVDESYNFHYKLAKNITGSITLNLDDVHIIHKIQDPYYGSQILTRAIVLWHGGKEIVSHANPNSYKRMDKIFPFQDIMNQAEAKQSATSELNKAIASTKPIIIEGQMSVFIENNPLTGVTFSSSRLNVTASTYIIVETTFEYLAGTWGTTALLSKASSRIKQFDSVGNIEKALIKRVRTLESKKPQMDYLTPSGVQPHLHSSTQEGGDKLEVRTLNVKGHDGAGQHNWGINIQPDTALTVAANKFAGIGINGDNLDPTAANCEIYGVDLDFSGVNAANAPTIEGIHIKMTAGDDAINVESGNINLVNPINEFSTDGTMAGNSDSAVSTEKAIVTFTAAQITTHAGVAAAHHAKYTDAEARAAVTVTGTYTGDGAGNGADWTAKQSITGLGFAPKYVKIWELSASYEWGEVTDQHPDATGCSIYWSSGDDTQGRTTLAYRIRTTASGFDVADGGADHFPNTNGTTFYYLAIG